jgi:hypothetical protein
MMDNRIGTPDLDVLQEMRQELLLQIDQSRETIDDCRELLNRVNAQIEGGDKVSRRPPGKITTY